MAEEIINIATLTIDKTEANKSIVETKQAIFELQKANSELRKDITKNGDVTGEQTKKFVENEQQLKQLNAQYKLQSAAINDLTLAELKESSALKDNAKSVAQANLQNKELIKTRNELDATTKEGAEAIGLINKKLEENRQFILSNSSQQEKAAAITGNYRQHIFGMGEALGGVGGKFGETARQVIGFGRSVSDVSDSLAKNTIGFAQNVRSQIGFTSTTVAATEATEVQTVVTEAQTVATEASTVATTGASASLKLLRLAIIATGIGALVVLVLSVVTAMSQSEAASNKFSRAMAGVKGIVSAVYSALAPLGELLIDKIVSAFETAGRVAEKALGLISKGLKAIGFDNAAKSVDNFTQSVKGSVKASQDLADAEAKYAAAQRYSQKIQLDYQKQAEKLRQVRDDESRSLKDRIAANQQLGATLKAQSNEELKIANQAVAIANLRIKLTGKSKENLDALAEAQTGVSDIQERISGQESEQLSNLNALRKEVEAANLERIKARQEASKKALEEAKTVIAAEVEANKKAFEEKKKLDETAKNDELANAEFLKQTQIKRIEGSKLLETDKALALAEIQKGYLSEVDVINKNFAASQKAAAEVARQEAATLAAVDAELRVLQLQEQGITEAEIQRQTLAIQTEQKKAALDQELIDEKKTAEEVRALKELEDKKYSVATKKIDAQVAMAKRAMQTGMVKDSLAAASAIFGESKALAIASALINTYEGITAGVKLGYPAAIPAVAAAAATGFAAVKNILKTNKDGGGAGATSSTTTTPAAQFENPARTQTVASVNAPPPQEAPAVSPPVLVLETLDEAKGLQQIKIGSI